MSNAEPALLLEAATFIAGRRRPVGAPCDRCGAGHSTTPCSSGCPARHAGELVRKLQEAADAPSPELPNGWRPSTTHPEPRTPAVAAVDVEGGVDGRPASALVIAYWDGMAWFDIGTGDEIKRGLRAWLPLPQPPQ